MFDGSRANFTTRIRRTNGRSSFHQNRICKLLVYDNPSKNLLYKLTFAPPTKGNVLPPSDENTVVVSTGFGPIRDPILQGLHVILAQSKEMECFLHVHQGTLIELYFKVCVLLYCLKVECKQPRTVCSMFWVTYVGYSTSTRLQMLCSLCCPQVWWAANRYFKLHQQLSWHGWHSRDKEPPPT